MEAPSSNWRFGPLHHAAGDVLLGDPLGNHAVVSSGGICGVQVDEFDEFVPWDSISQIDFSCDTTGSRIVSRARDGLAFVLAAALGDGTPFDPYDPGSLHLTTITGNTSTWQIDSMESGKYWRPQVEAAKVFLEMMRTKHSFRAIAEDSAELHPWLSSAVSHAQRNAQNPADPTGDSQF